MTALRPERGSESPSWEEDEPQQGVYRDAADPRDAEDLVDPGDPLDPRDRTDRRDPADPRVQRDVVGLGDRVEPRHRAEPRDPRDPLDRAHLGDPAEAGDPVDPADALVLDPLDPLGLGLGAPTPDAAGHQDRRESPLSPPPRSRRRPVDPRPLERMAADLQDEDTRVLNRRELGLGDPAPRGRAAAAAEESSDTITLRVPPPVVLPEAEPSETEPLEAAGTPAVGGRAERRRAEQQARRRGGRTAAAGKGNGKVARPKESAGIVAVRIMGELFITLGVVMFLFVAYQLWWTNVTADAYASGSAKTLEKQWGPPDGGTGTGTGIPPKDHAPYPSAISEGTKFALIYIPKLDVMTPIAEGVDKDSILDKGLVGHYTGALETAFPWDKTGNFALAGHRNTHGEPFRYINRLVPGDKIVVETAYDYYTYTVTSTLPQTSPSDVGVIAPVPPESGFKEPGRYITLTTCTPEFTSKYRMAVWGKLTQDLPKSSGQKPQALQTG
ncbi:class E sortase [Streptacidiphilus sp. N1-3]|uniref:Class E sortase n=1 Tax=Streptacidiphilus alkalitolerans TaxID=3342712 RepID=A0ABV6WZ94_9ACTN